MTTAFLLINTAAMAVAMGAAVYVFVQLGATLPQRRSRRARR